MAPSVTQKIFAYNPGPPIFGTIQVGDLAISEIDVEYSDNYGGVQWWGGPNEVNGYVIAYPVPSCDRPTPIFGLTACLGFKRSEFLTESSFIQLANEFVGGPPAPFASGNAASTYLTNNGYWNSWINVTPTPTPTLQVTQTPTPTITQTSTPTPTPTSAVTGDGWFFYTPEGTLAGPPNSNGNAIFIGPSNSTFNPNIATNVYFNNYTNGGTSYISQFTNLDTNGGQLTMTQGSNVATYSGTALQYVLNPTYLQLQISSASQIIQSAATPFVSGSPITLTFNVSPGVTPTPTITSTSTPTTTPTGTPSSTTTPTNTSSPTPTATSQTPTPTPTSGASGNFNVTISQVGPDVVWQGSGSFNLAALTSAGPNNIGGGFFAGQAIWAIGPSVTIDSYSGTITYPTSFGTGGTPVTSNTGSTFGILNGGSGRLLYVPSGYISNTTISGSSTYSNNTIAGMGLTPGVYTWSWGTGGNTSTLVMTIN
jgi:hypothetical protein